MNTTSTDTLYFAYGSNLDFEDLRASERFAELADLLEPVGPATLPDWELAFSRYSAGRGGGVLDVRPRVGATASGMLCRVHGNGWELLDRKEGAAVGAYRRCPLVAIADNGEAVPVVTYEVVDRAPFVEPGPDYLKIVLRGREAFDLPAYDVQNAARDRGTVLDGLFVYGTLMRGEPRFHCVRPEGLKCALLAELPGTLLDLGDYPGLVLRGGSERFVQGDFLRHREIGDVLTELDRIEGFRGWGREGSLYTRTIVDVGMCDGRVRRAWTYVLAETTSAPTILSGDWRAHRGTRPGFIERLVRAHCGSREPEIARALLARDATHEALPLADALARGALSERELAGASKNWVALTEP